MHTDKKMYYALACSGYFKGLFDNEFKYKMNAKPCLMISDSWLFCSLIQ